MSKLPSVFQNKWPTILISPISISNHKITVSSTVGLHVNQVICLKKDFLSEEFIIRRVLSDTQIQIGKIDNPFTTYENPIQFDGGSLEMYEQERNKMGSEIYFRAVYAEEPIVALRNILVDRYGQYWSETNPVPVTGTLSVDIGNEVEIKNDIDNPIPVSGSIDINNFPTTIDIGNFPTEIGVTGSVSITSLPEVEIKNDLDNPIPISKNTSVNSSGNPIYVSGDMTMTGKLPGLSLDAFSRLRISEPFTLGDYKHLYGIDPNFLDYIVNGGTVTHNVNKACATMTTSSNLTSRAVHQTKMYHHYQPGKSQLILSSVVFGYAQQNVTKRTGYFDDRDGIYFEQVGNGSSNGTNNGQLNWVIRSYTSGSPNESASGTYKRRVPQSEWNVDKCDGTGPSGFNINTSKSQLAWIDFQWLGVGRVQCGFVHNGEFVLAHEYYHSNNLAEVYLSNPNLPVRCEIFNTGITSGGNMDQICSTVATEGGYVESGIDFSVPSPLRTTTDVGQARFPLIAIRLKNSFQGYPNRFSVRLNNAGFYVETNSILYEIIKLPSAASLSTSINGGTLTWISADDSSGIEYCVNATAFVSADADRFASGFVPSGSSQNSLSPVASGALSAAKKNIISQNFDSTSSEVYVVVVSTIADGNVNAKVSCSLQWREIY